MSNAKLLLPAPPPKRRRLQLVRVKWQASPVPADTAASPDLDDDLAGEPGAPEMLPNDTLAALHLLKSRFPAEAAVAPFATRAQLYSVLTDRTLADRQLEELRHSAAVRLLQLPASRDECVVVLAADYEAAIQRCKANLEKQEQQQQQPSGSTRLWASCPGSRELEVFDCFAERVLPTCSEVMITHGQLLQLLTGVPPARTGQQQRQHIRPAAVTDGHVSLLLNQGLLTWHIGSPDGYLFSMPNAGAAVRSVAAGREEILSLLHRRRQPELLEADLLKRKLQRSVLGVRWHIADMVGGGALLRIPTAVGSLLRAAKRRG